MNTSTATFVGLHGLRQKSVLRWLHLELLVTSLMLTVQYKFGIQKVRVSIPTNAHTELRMRYNVTAR